jgi:hypothetical protein
MGDCEPCLEFTAESQHRRAERLHLWRLAGGCDDALPTLKAVRLWGTENPKSKRKAWKLLEPSATPQREHFNKFEGTKGGADASSEEDEESEDGEIDQGSPQEEEGETQEEPGDGDASEDEPDTAEPAAPAITAQYVRDSLAAFGDTIRGEMREGQNSISEKLEILLAGLATPKQAPAPPKGDKPGWTTERWVNVHPETPPGPPPATQKPSGKGKGVPGSGGKAFPKAKSAAAAPKAPAKSPPPPAQEWREVDDGIDLDHEEEEENFLNEEEEEEDVQAPPPHLVTVQRTPRRVARPGWRVAPGRSIRSIATPSSRR